MNLADRFLNLPVITFVDTPALFQASMPKGVDKPKQLHAALKMPVAGVPLIAVIVGGEVVGRAARLHPTAANHGVQ
jgi:acetyl-CoA carboxylase alpha subunit